MSIRLVAAALDVPGLTPVEKLVLVSYADYANAEGLCWPSNDTAARRAELTPRGLRLVRRRLEEAGLLRVERSGGGRNRANVYRVTIPVKGEPLFPVSVPERGNGGAVKGERGRAKGGTAVPPNRKEPSRTAQVATATTENPRPDPATCTHPTWALIGTDTRVCSDCLEERTG